MQEPEILPGQMPGTGEWWLTPDQARTRRFHGVSATYRRCCREGPWYRYRKLVLRRCGLDQQGQNTVTVVRKLRNDLEEGAQ